MNVTELKKFEYIKDAIDAGYAKEIEIEVHGIKLRYIICVIPCIIRMYKKLYDEFTYNERII